MRTAYTVYYSARPGRKIRQRGSYTQESRQAASHSHQGIRKGPRQGIGQGPRPNIWPLAGHTYVRSPKHEPTYVYGRGASEVRHEALHWAQELMEVTPQDVERMGGQTGCGESELHKLARIYLDPVWPMRRLFSICT